MLLAEHMESTHYMLYVSQKRTKREGAIAASWEDGSAPTTGNQGSAASSEVGSILL